jgi:hypothetical protein
VALVDTSHARFLSQMVGLRRGGVTDRDSVSGEGHRRMPAVPKETPDRPGHRGVGRLHALWSGALGSGHSCGTCTPRPSSRRSAGGNRSRGMSGRDANLRHLRPLRPGGFGPNGLHDRECCGTPLRTPWLLRPHRHGERWPGPVDAPIRVLRRRRAPAVDH